jgi:hypothetical protein
LLRIDYDRAMLAEDSDLASHRIYPSERAYDAVWDADACVLCGAPELDRAASERATLEWLERYDAALAGAPYGGNAGTELPKSWEDVRSRAAIDSQLGAAYPWQLDATDAIVAEVVDTELERIAFDEFLFPICGRCSANDEPVATAVMRRAYVDFKFDGNPAAAAAQRQWRLVEHFLDVIARIAQPRSA